MKNENGRSMVEMLGVLALIGVLSVMGIYGYTFAMRKHRANEIMQTATMLTIMAHAANRGDGDCIKLSDSNLTQKVAGVDLEMVANAENNSVCIKISGIEDQSEVDALCELVQISGPCGAGDCSDCDD